MDILDKKSWINHLMSFTLNIFKKSLMAVQPSSFLNKTISIIENKKIRIGSDLILENKKIKFISFGKAGGSMAEAFLDIMGYNNIDEGIIVTPEDSKKPNINNPNVEVIYSTHPQVSEKSVIAGHKILKFAERCTVDDIVFCLISGGGSALIASPINGIDVNEKIDLINNLLKMGIGEREVNVIRKKLSKIKGGSLAQKIYPAQIVNLILSDERDHQLEAIASGPTVINQSNITAEQIINTEKLWRVISKEMHSVFRDNSMSVDKPYPQIDSYIVGSRELLLQRMKDVADENEVKNIKVIEEFYDHDIINLKNELSSHYSKYYKKSEKGKYLIVASGEVPIKLSSNHGKGGRNQHLAALMIKELKKYINFEFLAISSDGCDYLNGVHGALITNKHIEKIYSESINIDYYINNFNTNELHDKIGSLIKGPMTGTNVNDFYLFYFEK